MDKCPSGSDNFRFARTNLGTQMTWYHHCVCVSNEHLVVLNQMSDPNFFGLDKMSKWLDNV